MKYFHSILEVIGRTPLTRERAHFGITTVHTARCSCPESFRGRPGDGILLGASQKRRYNGGSIKMRPPGDCAFY
jgi:hypothetical protein